MLLPWYGARLTAIVLPSVMESNSTVRLGKFDSSGGENIEHCLRPCFRQRQGPLNRQLVAERPVQRWKRNTHLLRQAACFTIFFIT